MAAGSTQSVPAEESAGRKRSRRHILWLVAAVIFGLALLPPFTIVRLKPRVAGALARSLGRAVTIGDVKVRFFPTPALVLTHVAIADDPAFSSEPLLVSDEVTATVRLASIWRGRLEIARLSFDSPSLNLTRRGDGHWNLEPVLERAREAPVAPTAKRTAGPRLRFPYIEAEGGRVNLKLGPVKTVFALGDADFALWLERENEWNLRLTAHPIRTDANISDAGTVKLSGTVGRGDSLSDTPLNLRMILQDAQLGQLTTLLYGRDRGWRGTVNASTQLRGTPAALRIQTNASVNDFTRYDIFGSGSMLLRTTCSAAFHSSSQEFDDLKCSSPVGNGRVEARGSVSGIFPVRGLHLSLSAQDVPAAAVAALVRRMKKDLPEDVSATGAITGTFSVERTGTSAATWTAAGEAAELSLQSSRMDEPLVLRDVRFSSMSDNVKAGQRNLAAQAAGSPARAGFARDGVHAAGSPARAGLQAAALVMGPVEVDLGGKTAAHAQAFFSSGGYRINVRGDSGLKRLFQVSEALGVAAPRFSPQGEANLDLSIEGAWARFAQPLVLGTATVKAATVPVNGIGTPVTIDSAAMKLEDEGIEVDHLSFGWPKAGVNFSGTLQVPRHCTTIETCPVTFRLHSDEVDVADLNKLLNPQAQKRPWYAFMSSRAVRNPLLARVAASGTVSVSRLEASGVAAKNVSGAVSLRQGVLVAKGVRGTALGGELNGDLRAEFEAVPAQFEVSGTLARASVAALSGTTRPAWGTGTMNLSFTGTATGLGAAAIENSASGTIHFGWRNGTVSMVLEKGAGPLRVHDFRGTATLRGGRFRFGDATLTTGAGKYSVSGTASLDQQLELTLSRANVPAYQITGTLDRPKVLAPAAGMAAQARLQQ